MKSHSNNWNIFFVTLIISLVLLLCIVIGVLLYKLLKKTQPQPQAPSQPQSPSQVLSQPQPKVRILPDRNNKVILIDGEFHRVDPGLYTRPDHYPGVIHHGPEFIDLNS